MDQIILFGDSLLQQSAQNCGNFNFYGALTDAYIRKLDVVNRGHSGYNTERALQIIDRVIPSPSNSRIRLLVVLFGANDARLHGVPGLPGLPEQHVPLSTYKENIRTIVQHPLVQAHPGVKIILVTPPPVDERNELATAEEHGERPKRTQRTAATTATYAQAVREVGREEHLLVLDFWLAVMQKAGYTDNTDAPLPGSLEAPPNQVLQSFLHDGLHLTSDAYHLFFDALIQKIRSSVPELDPEHMERLLPNWDDVPAWDRYDAGGS